MITLLPVVIRQRMVLFPVIASKATWRRFDSLKVVSMAALIYYQNDSIGDSNLRLVARLFCSWGSYIHHCTTTSFFSFQDLFWILGKFHWYWDRPSRTERHRYARLIHADDMDRNLIGRHGESISCPKKIAKQTINIEPWQNS